MANLNVKNYTKFSYQTYRFKFYKTIKSIEKEELDSKANDPLICLLEKYPDDNDTFIDKVLDKLERQIKITKEEIRYICFVIEKSHSARRFGREN